MAVIGYFAFTRLYLEPRNQEAMDNMWKAQYYFEIDSLDRALYGDDNYYGFDYISSEYGNTAAGKLANHYIGLIYMEKGEYEVALDYLKKANESDIFLGAAVKGNIGDAYAELGELDQALNYYEQAANHSTNTLTTPVYLKKAGLIAERLEKTDLAKKHYERIKDEFPNSQEARDIDYYLGRAGL